MAIALEQSESLSLLRLEGVIDIGSAAELKEQLLKALAPGAQVRVSLAAAADLDVTAVQLLWAAERKARGTGVGFSVTDAPEPLLAALGEAGLRQFVVPCSEEQAG